MRCYRFNRKCEIREGIVINAEDKKLEGFSGKLEIMGSNDSPCIENRDFSVYIQNLKENYLIRADISHNPLKKELVLKRETDETKKDILLYFNSCISKKKDISDILAVDEKQDAGPLSSFPRIKIIDFLINREERLRNYSLKMLFVLPRNHKVILPVESEIYPDNSSWLRNLENMGGKLKYFIEKQG